VHDDLVRLATKAESEAARVAAIKEPSRPWLWSRRAANRRQRDVWRERAAGGAFKENAGGTLGSEIGRRALPAPNGEDDQELH